MYYMLIPSPSSSALSKKKEQTSPPLVETVELDFRKLRQAGELTLGQSAPAQPQTWSPVPNPFEHIFGIWKFTDIDGFHGMRNMKRERHVGDATKGLMTWSKGRLSEWKGGLQLRADSHTRGQFLPCLRSAFPSPAEGFSILWTKR